MNVFKELAMDWPLALVLIVLIACFTFLVAYFRGLESGEEQQRRDHELKLQSKALQLPAVREDG